MVQHLPEITTTNIHFCIFHVILHQQQLHTPLEMPERRPWTAEEDQILRSLHEDQHIQKWCVIAQKMADKFHIRDRTGKQCRERYHNHLDSSIVRAEWTTQQEQYLYRLHDEVGNKWAIIAQKLPGRTDNCVKNHFYSKLRKSLRKLNKAIHLHFRKDLKEIKVSVLYKIVEASDQRFQSFPSIDQEVSLKCSKLKNMLLLFSQDGTPMDDNMDGQAELAKGILDFSANYRRRVRKYRRSSASGYQVASKLPVFSPKTMSDGEEGSNGFDDDSHDDEEEEHVELNYLNPLESIKEVDDGKECRPIGLLSPQLWQSKNQSHQQLKGKHGHHSETRVSRSMKLKELLQKPPTLVIGEQGKKASSYLESLGVEFESPVHQIPLSSIVQDVEPPPPLVDSENRQIEIVNVVDEDRDMEMEMELDGEEKNNVNFLSESIEKLRLNANMMLEEDAISDVDDDLQLFPSA